MALNIFSEFAPLELYQRYALMENTLPNINAKR